MKKLIIIVLNIMTLYSCQSFKIEESTTTDIGETEKIIEVEKVNGITKKTLPVPSSYSMLPPDMDYKYFEYYKEFPFEPQNTTFSLTNCWWLSEASFLSYAHPGFAKMAYELSGFPNFKYFEDSGTECMIAWNTEVILLSFRGTELNSNSAIYDIAIDLNTIPEDFDMGGTVHSGFKKALNNIWDGTDGLKIFIDNLHNQNPDIPLWVTGHSLGAAIAGICFTKLDYATGLYTFGSPRIGDNDFINLSSDRPIWRIENYKDPVPRVPLNLPRINFYFGEMGTLIYLTDNGEMKSEKESLPALSDYIDNSKVELVDFVKQRRLYRDIDVKDHMPINYTSKIWNLLLDSKKQDMQ